MATYARFEMNGRKSYGIVRNGRIEELQGGLFDDPQALRAPVRARTKSGFSRPASRPKFWLSARTISAIWASARRHRRPEIFYKPISSLQDPGRADRDPGGRRGRSLRRRIGCGDRQDRSQCLARGSGGGRVRRDLRQRRERPQLAAGRGQRRAVVARERMRYVRAAGPGDRYGTGLFRSCCCARA